MRSSQDGLSLHQAFTLNTSRQGQQTKVRTVCETPSAGCNRGVLKIRGDCS